jgi:hypothetical protein
VHAVFFYVSLTIAPQGRKNLSSVWPANGMTKVKAERTHQAVKHCWAFPAIKINCVSSAFTFGVTFRASHKKKVLAHRFYPMACGTRPGERK